MKKQIKKLLCDKQGKMYVGVFLFLALVLFIAFLCAETMKLYDMQEYTKEQVYRSCNIAVKEAMLDSYRLDGESRISEDTVKANFYESLERDMGLNSNLEKYNDGKKIIEIVIEEINVDENNARMEVKGKIITGSVFEFAKREIALPFKVKSKNMRLDNYS